MKKMKLIMKRKQQKVNNAQKVPHEQANAKEKNMNKWKKKLKKNAKIKNKKE